MSADAWRTRVLDFLHEQRQSIVADLSASVRLPSVSGSDHENDIQHELCEQVSDLGLEVDSWEIPLAETLGAAGFPGVEVDRREAWGLVARISGAGSDEDDSLMFNAHVDVVPPGTLRAWRGSDPFSGHIDAEYVHGRGSCDMKGGLIAAMWVVRALARLQVPLRGDLLLACVQGEEDGGLGTFSTIERGWSADACVIPEPTSLDLVPANAGSLTFRLRIPGRATHASRRTSGVSAVEKFIPVFNALRRLESQRNMAVHPLMARWDIAYPIEIGMVRSGDWSSTVPDLLVAEGRFGVALEESPESAKSMFVAAIREVCEGDAWLRNHPVEIEWWGGQFTPGLTDLDASILGSLRRAHSSVSDYRQEVWGAPYGSDLRLMSGRGGVPTIHYGPGDARLAHGPMEKVPIAEVFTATNTLAVLALDYCGVR